MAFDGSNDNDELAGEAIRRPAPDAKPRETRLETVRRFMKAGMTYDEAESYLRGFERHEADQHEGFGPRPTPAELARDRVAGARSPYERQTIVEIESLTNRWPAKPERHQRIERAVFDAGNEDVVRGLLSPSGLSLAAHDGVVIAERHASKRDGEGPAERLLSSTEPITARMTPSQRARYDQRQGQRSHDRELQPDDPRHRP